MIQLMFLSSVLSIAILFTPSVAHAATFSTAGVRLNKPITPLRELKRRNVVTQSLDFSCGAAGLSTLLRYYHGDAVSEQEIIEALLATVPLEKVKGRHGFSLLDLKAFAESRGYLATGYKMDIKFLSTLGKPVLVPIKFRNYSHFVIVKGVRANRIFLADPAVGNVSMKTDQFQRIWTGGIGLVVERPGNAANPKEYALEVQEKDLLLSDYKYLNRVISKGMIRTTVFPTEF